MRLSVAAAFIFAAVSQLDVCAQESNLASEADSKSKKLLYGTLDAGPRKFRFVIELAGTDDESTGMLKSLDEGNSKFKLEALTKTDSEFAFELKATKAKYDSKFDPEKQVYVGTWRQNGAELPLDFAPVESIPKEVPTALWQGQLKVLFQKLDVQFRELDSGEAFFDSITQKVGGFVANKKQVDNEITFDVPAVRGKFVGLLSEDGNTLEGKWRQGLVAVELVLKKGDVDAVAPPPEKQPLARPQTPKAPFPYQATDVTFESAEADIELAGTLTVPDGPGPFPAVVLVSGSGPQDRDETLLEHKPFWVIADHFARNGIAALRFDDRGVGQSKGSFQTSTSKDFASDAQGAVSFLRQHAKIDDRSIGICGHSEGGIVGPMVAANDPQVAFLILMAGTGVDGEQILISQAKAILEVSGLQPEQLDRQSKIQQTFLKLAMTEPELSSNEFVDQALEALQPLLTEGEIERDAGRAMAQAAAAQLLNPWYRYFIKYDPSESLRQLSCPVLALNGERDLQVLPKLNLPAIQAALDSAPTTDFQTIELPELNHLFQHCETGLISEYAEIEETFSREVLELMTEWILKRTLPAKR